jgi:hypothetical protein
MTHRNGFKFLPGLVLAGAVGAMALGSGGCSAVSNAAAAAQGCDEFNGGVSGVASLSIDANTKAFVTAAAQLQNVATTMEASVLNACIGIATDLGQMDTWSAMGPDGGGSTDAETTEACNKAVAGINAALMAATTAQVTCGLTVSGGECQVNAMAQVSCEGSCTGSANCMMGSIEARCTPAQVTGQCSGNCNASATCEGSATVAANCQGTCSGQCTGTCTPPSAGSIDCTGTCMGNCNGTCNGTAQTTGMCAGMCQGKCDAACQYMAGMPGSCSGSCKGTCSGSCKLDATAMVNCGANVNCTGGCSVAYTAPQCEGKLTPPMCNIDANCEASCQSQAEFQAMCTPPQVALQCTGMVTTQITALVMTLQNHLPAIFLAAKTQGQLALDAAQLTAKAGANVVGNVGSLGGKAIACATVAAKAAVSASASVNVSVMASASVSGSASAGS